MQAPNVVESGTAPPSTSCYATTGMQQWVFMADFGLYNVKRCEVRRQITFVRQYQTTPMVWGRPYGTSGGVTPSNPNGQVAWTGVVPGSVTTTGATLRTYVYERWTVSGQYLGWYPRPPSQAGFSYALLGQPYTPPPPGPLSVTIDGPTQIDPGVSSTWTADATGGSTPYDFTWYRKENDGYSGFDQVGTSGTYIGESSACWGFDLRVDVSSSDSQNASETITVGVNEQGQNGQWCLLRVTGPQPVSDAPDAFMLIQDAASTDAATGTASLATSGLTRTSAPTSRAVVSDSRVADAIRDRGIMAVRFGIPAPQLLLSRSSSPNAKSGVNAGAKGARAGGTVPVQIRIFDASGRTIRVAVDNSFAPGYYRYEWDGLSQSGARAAPGVYVALMTAPGFSRTSKLIVVR